LRLGSVTARHLVVGVS